MSERVNRRGFFALFAPEPGEPFPELAPEPAPRAQDARRPTARRVAPQAVAPQAVAPQDVAPQAVAPRASGSDGFSLEAFYARRAEGGAVSQEVHVRMRPGLPAVPTSAVGIPSRKVLLWGDDGPEGGGDGC